MMGHPTLIKTEGVQVPTLKMGGFDQNQIIFRYIAFYSGRCGPLCVQKNIDLI